MEVKINKEIRDFTENIFFGLSLRQFIFSVLACGISILLYFLLRNYFSIGTLSWMCILGASPFALLGFVKINGLTAEQFIKAFVISEILTPKRLLFKPMNYYNEINKEYHEELRKMNLGIKSKEKPKKKRKLKIHFTID